jgi:hypothetical protein
MRQEGPRRRQSRSIPCCFTAVVVLPIYKCQLSHHLSARFFSEKVSRFARPSFHTGCTAEGQRKTATWAAKAHPHVREMLQCPTPKTAGLDGALSHVRFVVRRLDSNVQFACSRRVKRLAFTTYTKGRRALSDLTFLLSGGDPSTVVAFGAGTFSPTSKGHAPGPVKKLRRELSSICRVRATNEDYTSQACSRCGHKSKLVGPRRKEAKEGGAGQVGNGASVPKFTACGFAATVA